MKYAALLGILALVGAGFPEPKSSGSQIVIHGTILSVDPSHRTARIHHGALETMPASDRTCRVADSSDLRALHRGDTFEAIADTMHSPWMLAHVRVVKKSG